MNIAIFCAGNMGVYINRQFTSFYSDLHAITCFIDNNPQLDGVVIDGLQVASMDRFITHLSKDTDAVIIAVISLNSLWEIAEQLRQNGIYKFGWVKTSAYAFNKKLIIDKFGNSNLILWANEANKPILQYLEANIVDECNLKCKGCTHFSNLFSEESHYNLSSFERDLTQISHNCYIATLHLLGGEPLLCDNLDEYIDLAREILPYTDIIIVTNGLLVFKHSDKLYDSMRKNDVGFRISPYTPTVKIKNKIAEFLLSKGVDFIFGIHGKAEEISKFNKLLSKTYDSDCAKSMSACSASGCRFLRDGKLYKCPVEGMIYKFFDTYKISSDLRCGIDIYNISNWNKIIEELKNPVSACKYCPETPQLMDWEVSARPDMRDWIVT